jgi:hypothetical protein
LSLKTKVLSHTKPGWYIGLEDYQVLNNPLELEIIRIFQGELSKLLNQLTTEVGTPIYFPFEMGTNRPIRPMQGYLFKLPRFFINLFYESLSDDAFRKNAVHEKIIDKMLESEYRFANEETAVGERDPFSIDPAIVERGLHSHATTQNALANFLKNQQITPLSPGSDEPCYYLAWIFNEEIWVAEVKSITNDNEEKQLRLGLGQVLRYCQILKTKGKVQGILVIERAPSDLSWVKLCEDHNLILVWPEIFQEKINR